MPDDDGGTPATNDNGGTPATNSVTKMAAVKLPDRLAIGNNAVKNWKIFKQRWSTYSIITELDQLPISKQRALFIHCLDDDALEAYNTLDLPEEATVANIVKAFELFIVGECNETYERYIFNKRNQEDGEPFELFYADLQRLMKTCNYCNQCKNSLLKDRIVLGIKNPKIQRELLKVRKLTLEQTVDICKANEKAITQNRTLRPEVNKVSVRTKTARTGSCKFCGRTHEWDKNKCPAFGKTCMKCSMKNHFAKMCKNTGEFSARKKVHKVFYEEEEESDYEEDSSNEWINKVSTRKNTKCVNCVMEVNGKPVKFQIDTGSSVNILPVNFLGKRSIPGTEVVLRTWNNNDYKPLGECRVTLKNPKNQKKYNVNFVICEENFTPIIGLSASEQMKLVEIKEKNFEYTNKIDVKEYSKVFNGDIGTFKGEHRLQIKQNSHPQIMPNRRIPIALNDKLKVELKRLTELGVIAPMEEPTEWVSQIVLVKKPDGSVRLCIDPQELNKVIVRERYTLPTLDDSIHELSNSKVFSKTDLASGYWHVKLDHESSKLTTFQTTFGRYRWIRLPFGISTSAEIFQRKLHEALANLEGVLCIADDIIIHGKTIEEHDANMRNFLRRCEEQNIRLNASKTKLNVDNVSFMGHKLTKKGLEVDEAKVRAIEQFPTPKNVSQLRSFLGIVNFVSKFIPKMSEILHPLHNLLKRNVIWMWSTAQEESFKKIKKLIAESTQLVIYDPQKKLEIENDASEYGLGSVLLQEGKPIAFASRSLSECERRYAQIEKEMLAVVFGLNKFHHYIYGRDITVVTDHKPLTAIVMKSLNKAPKRIQSMILKIQDYNYNLIYKPGPAIPIADALSRNPVDSSSQINFISNLDLSPVSEDRFLQIKRATETDAALRKLRLVIAQGWPETRGELPPEVTPYFNYRDEMTIEDGIVLRGERIVIPTALRYEMKQKIHAGHLGINSCLRRARTHVYWPGMSAEIRQFVENCSTCSSLQRKQPAQPLYLRKIPSRPWQEIALDIFTIKGRNYLITTDYYSQFFEVDFLKNDLTSTNIIFKLKAHFSRYGLPEKIVSDNGTQFVSREFRNFCQSYKIKQETISPGNSKSNGAAEAAVKVAKNLMKKCNLQQEDPYIALLNYRNTPQEGVEYSPAQRLMGRRTNTLIPTIPALLRPETVQHNNLEKQREKKQLKMCERFSERNSLKHLEKNENVWIQPIQPNTEIWKPAVVAEKLTNRSYIVETENGSQYRRNREHLRCDKSSKAEIQELEEEEQKETPASEQEESKLRQLPRKETEINTTANDDGLHRTRSGRISKKPERYEP